MYREEGRREHGGGGLGGGGSKQGRGEGDTGPKQLSAERDQEDGGHLQGLIT